MRIPIKAEKKCELQLLKLAENQRNLVKCAYETKNVNKIIILKCSTISSLSSTHSTPPVSLTAKISKMMFYCI